MMQLWTVIACFLMVCFPLNVKTFYQPNYDQLNEAVDNVLNRQRNIGSEWTLIATTIEHRLKSELDFFHHANDFGSSGLNQLNDLHLNQKFSSEYVADPLGVTHVQELLMKTFNDSIVDIDFTQNDNGHAYFMLTFSQSIAICSNFSKNINIHHRYYFNARLISSTILMIDGEVHTCSLNIKNEVMIMNFNRTLNKLEMLSVLNADIVGHQLSSFKVPLTGSWMLAVIGETMVSVYNIEMSNGQLDVNLCDHLLGSDISDVAAFSINAELYLAVASKNFSQSHIWKLMAIAGHFIFDHSLAVENALSLTYFQRNYYHYVLITNEDGSFIYKWEGRRFYLYQRLQTILQRKVVILNHMADIYGNDVIILPHCLAYSQNNRFVHSLSAATLMEYLPSFNNWMAATINDQTILVTWMDKRMVIYRVDLARIEPILSAKEDALKRKLTYFNEQLDIMGEMAKQMSEQEVTDSGSVNDGKCEKLSGRVEEVSKRANELHAKLDDVNVEWSWVMVAGKLSSKKTQLNFLNGINISDWFIDAIRKNDGNKEISGFKRFTGGVTFKNNSKITTWNERRFPEEYVMTHMMQNTTGSNWKFISDVKVEKDVNIRGRINSIDMSNDLIRLHHDAKTSQKLTGSVVFTEQVTSVDGIKIGGLVDGYSLSEMAQNVLVSNGSETVLHQPASFRRLIVDGDVVVNKVNGISLSDFERDVVFKNKRTLITGKKMIKGDLQIDRNLDINSIDGFKFPESFVLKSTTTANSVLNLKRFSKELTINGQLDIDGHLSNVLLNDVFRLHGDQKISGHKTFTNAILNTINVSEPFLDYNTTIAGHFKVINTINDVDVVKIGSGVINRSNLYNITFTNDVTFIKNQNLTNTNVSINGPVNGLNVETDFVRLDATNEVLANKTFEIPVTFVGDIAVHGGINGLDFDSLKEDLVPLNAGHQVIMGKKIFYQGLTVNSLTIDDHQKDRSLRVKGRGILAANVQVKGNVFVKGHVNDKKFEDLANERVTLTTAQTLQSNLQLDATSSLVNVFVDGKFSGVNVGSLWQDVLWRNGHGRPKQIVTGQKTIFGQISTPEVFTHSGINNVVLPKFARRTVFVHNNQYVNEPSLRFSSIEVKGDHGLVVDGLLNGYNVSKIFSDAVSSSQSNRFQFKNVKTFSELEIVGSLWVKEGVNGINVDKQLLNTVTKQNVTGNLAFCGGVVATDVMTVDHLMEEVTRKLKFLRLTGNVRLDELKSNGNINGINLTEKLLQISLLSDDKMISGMTFKKNVKFERDLNVIGNINGYDYINHFKQIVTKQHSNVTFTAVKEFRDDVFINSNVTLSKLVLDGYLHDKDGNQETVIQQGFTLDGKLHVNGNIEIKNSLNLGAKNSLTINGDLTTGSVNGDDLLKVSADTLNLNGKQRITGLKVFTGNVTVEDYEWITFGKKVVFSAGVNVTEFCPIYVS